MLYLLPLLCIVAYVSSMDIWPPNPYYSPKPNPVTVSRTATANGVLSVYNSTSKTTSSIDVGFDVVATMVSPDGGYVVAVDEKGDRYVVYDLIAKKQICVGGAELNGTLYKVLSDERYIYLVLFNTTMDPTWTVAYIDKNAAKSATGSCAFTVTQIPITMPSIFGVEFEMRKVNGLSYLQVASGKGGPSSYKLTSDGKNWKRVQ